MKRRAATGVDASGELDEAPEGAGLMPVRAGADRPLAVAGPETEDTELEEPLPDADRLVAEAVALAGEGLDTARLGRRDWRVAPGGGAGGGGARGAGGGRRGPPAAGRPPGARGPEGRGGGT